MEWTAGMSIAMLNTPDFRHADPTGVPNTNNKTSETSKDTKNLKLSDIEAIQQNLEFAIDSPEELTFNGSVTTASFDLQLNLEF